MTDHAPSAPPASGTHTLAVASTTGEQRAATAAWLDRELVAGTKVYYKSRPDDWEQGGRDWLVGPAGPPGAAAAVASGQLEILDFVEVIGKAGGTTEGLRRLQTEELERGLDEGWPRVAMSQESPGRPMADAAEIAEFVAQEAAYDELALARPLTTRCQLTLALENRAAIWETAAVHCGGVLDGQWSARWMRGRWELSGEIDVHVVASFGAALHGALRRSRDDAADGELHVDASAVDFFDVASAHSLVLATHAAARHQTVVVHGARAHLRDVIAAVGRPRTLRFSDDQAPR